MAPKTSIDRALERERRKEERRQARREKKEQVNPNTARCASYTQHLSCFIIL